MPTQLPADAFGEPTSRFYESSGLRLHYVVWGDESRSPLILVHGGRDHARSWDLVAPRLADHFAVYAVDLRGHGDSEWARGSHYMLFESVVDLAVLLEILGRPVYLLGHSRGATIVLQAAVTLPDKILKVVAIEAFASDGDTPDQPVPGRMRQYLESQIRLEGRRPRTYPTLEAAAARWRETHPRVAPELCLYLTRHATRQTASGGYMWKFDNRARNRSPYEWSARAWQEIWSAINCPVLLLRGSESQHQDPAVGN